MDSMVNNLRRLFLAFLLILLLIGLSGHLIAPSGGSHHVFSESTCAFHQGVNLPANFQPSWNESGTAPEPARNNTCALDVVINIPHPPAI